MKNIFKIGDKVKVKENFWEIEGDVYLNNNMKKLAGRVLEVQSISSSGNVYTKQDDSNNQTTWNWHKDWLELYNPTITWETLKWKDVLVGEDGDERMVLGVLNDVVFLSWYNDFDEVNSNPYTKKELQNDGYTIKQPTPVEEPKGTIEVGGYTYKLVK